MRVGIALIMGLAAFLPISSSPAWAGDAPASLVKFLDFLKGDKRDAALSMIVKSVRQLTGSPITMSGGPNSGPWANQIVRGKAVLTPAQAFGTFANCTLGRYGPVKKQVAKTLQVLVVYNCPDARGVHFIAQASTVPGKVEISQLGQSPYIVDEKGAAVLWGLD